MSILSLYHALPGFAQSWAATAWGWKLRQWRYGSETEEWVVRYLDADRESPDARANRVKAELQRQLTRAIRWVPAYRERMSNAPPDAPLSAWPILRKDELRRDPERYLAEDWPRSRLLVEHTSGSTGAPLRLWQPRETSRRWYALMEARWRQWYGVSRHDAWAILGGQLVAPVERTKPPFWVWSDSLHQLYLSAYHLAPDHARHYVRALGERRVTYLWGYASALASLARFVLEQRLDAPPMRVAISNAEPLSPAQRDVIGRAFRCPVRDTYGMCEQVAAASECEAGRLHLWPEVGVAEVLAADTDEPVTPGTVGRLVCTGLLNPAMPLVRYEVGDRVALAPETERCSCGRTLPLVLSIEGRMDDVIYTRDGREVGRLDPVFKAELPIREAQIVQESLEDLRVLVVPAPGFSEATANQLIRALGERLPETRVTVESVNQIPRGRNGKFKAVVSKVTR